MRLVGMQPYFLPYLGYFDLLNLTDTWIVFDTPQYRKHSWVNRNRILRAGSGWQYILVPTKQHPHDIPINQKEILPGMDWRGLILRQLEHYKKDAPYYKEVVSFLEEGLSGLGGYLADVNITLFRKVAQYLGIEKPIHVFSKMNLTLPGPVNTPGDWGVRIAQAVGASEFVNRPGGAAFIDESIYRENGIRLIFQSFTNMKYGCGKYHQYEPDMSIIDVMMWNSPEEIKTYLDTWRLGSSEKI
jgi:hypothetical protein